MPLAAPQPPLALRFSRRTVLRNSGLGLGLGLAAVTGSAVLGGCTLTVGAPSDPDPFIALAASARADSEMAGQLSVQLPDQAAALTTIAGERTAHADALEAELLRANGPTTPAPQPGVAADAQGQTPQPPPPTLDGLRAALSNAQRAAADTARSNTGYRAGLAGSISAACAAQNEVLLP